MVAVAASSFVLGPNADSHFSLLAVQQTCAPSSALVELIRLIESVKGNSEVTNVLNIWLSNKMSLTNHFMVHLLDI